MPGATPPVPATTAVESASAAISLMEVTNWDGESQGIYKALTTAFGAGDYLECIKDLRARHIEPLSYIDNLNRIVDSLPVGSEFRKQCTRALRKTCGLYGILPACYEVASELSLPTDRLPTSRGGFADVWRLTDEKDNKKVFAVKYLRVYEEDPVDKINKRYCKEVVVCKLVKHPNVLSIEGVAPKLYRFCMVSQWMENGNLLQYVAKHPGANRLELLIGIAHGLSYLHSSGVVHGDLKGENILVNMEGSPCLTDFGFCSITKNITSVHASTPNHGCTVRYSAPELLDVGGVRAKTKLTDKSDVYSFSMVIVELATGKKPYPELLDTAVVIKVSKGKRPPKPDPFEVPGMPQAVWKIAEKCWHEKAKERPDANTVIQSLGNITNATGASDKRPSSLRQFLRGVFPD